MGGPTENRTRATLPAISGSHGNSRSTTLETLKNGRHTAKLQPSFIILLREPSSLTSWTHGIQLGGVSQKGMEKKMYLPTLSKIQHSLVLQKNIICEFSP